MAYSENNQIVILKAMRRSKPSIQNHPANHWFDLADFQIRRLIFYLNPDLDGLDQARVTVDGNKIVCKGWHITNMHMVIMVTTFFT